MKLKHINKLQEGAEVAILVTIFLVTIWAVVPTV